MGIFAHFGQNHDLHIIALQV